MFCIKSDVITLGSIEMYGLVIVWTSMDDGPYSVILLNLQVDGSTGSPGFGVLHGQTSTCHTRINEVYNT